MATNFNHDRLSRNKRAKLEAGQWRPVKFHRARVGSVKEHNERIDAQIELEMIKVRKKYRIDEPDVRFEVWRPR